MLAVRPLKAWEWLVTMAVASVVELPYDVVVPYSTSVSELSLVVHVMVAPALVRFVDWTAD